jgi:hypothetical protein
MAGNMNSIDIGDRTHKLHHWRRRSFHFVEKRFDITHTLDELRVAHSKTVVDASLFRRQGAIEQRLAVAIERRRRRSVLMLQSANNLHGATDDDSKSNRFAVGANLRSQRSPIRCKTQSTWLACPPKP